MATIPLFPTATNTPMVYDDSDYEDVTSESGDDVPLPAFNINLSDDSDDSGEYDDEDDEGGVMPSELVQLMNLQKPTTAFPMATQRTPLQPFIPTTNLQTPFPQTTTQFRQPTIPFPQTVVQLPQTTKLQLNVLPTHTAPQPTTLTLTPMKPTTVPGIPQMTVPVIPQMTVPGIPQMTVPGIPQMTVPGIPQMTMMGITKPLTPGVPALPGLAKTLTPGVPALPGLAKTLTPVQVTNKAVDVTAILENMPGISITTVTGAPVQVQTDIVDLIRKEDDEDANDFEARRRLTLQLASIPDYKLNNTAAVTAGLIMMKKAKLGVTYDPDVEAAISYLTSLLQRK